MSSATTWKAWSIPVDIPVMRHKSCGLLNKLTQSNFDSICTKLVDWAVAVERTGDSRVLDVLVHDIFSRGVTDHVRSRLYASLCQRIIDELEGERSRWKKVDVYYLGNPVHTFETDIRLLAHKEFQTVVATDDPKVLMRSMSFAGELLVHGVILSEDLQDIVDVLFDKAECNDEERTIALCRFLSRLVSAFDAYRVLNSLNVVYRLEGALKKATLSYRTRYLLMSMLEQVVFPRPHDAFSSTRDRIEVYGIDLDESDVGSVGGEEEELEEDRIRRTCSACATVFFTKRDEAPVRYLFQMLRPTHRAILVEEFITTALHENDPGDAMAVGSMLSAIATTGLFDEDNSLTDGLNVQLAWLEDTSLDAPRAPQTMAALLYGAGFSSQVIENMAKRSIPSSSPILATLLSESRVLHDSPDVTSDTQDNGSDDRRRNRFERGSY
ncbi:hypothetical protein EIP86_011142 [Pleurotus ostreatoroseus]|nr:hypothetical protein EIP86_011142 [Pleurotus ostreatoroseus]